MILIGLVLAAGAAIAVIAAVGGSGGGGAPPPPLPMLRGSPAKVEANLKPLVHTIESRVETLRGLRFVHPPRVVVMSESQLAAVGERLGRAQHRHAELDPARLRAARRLERASTAFDQLAGLLPPEFAFGPDTKAAGLDRIGGAFDYRRNRIIIVPPLIQTRIQLDYTLAHELTHALESQHFHLGLGSLTAPDEATQVRRAVIEGSATFIQDRYRQRYLHDQVPLRERLTGMRSVIGASRAPFAINAQAVFDYVDGALFIDNLYQRAYGFRLINRAERQPPWQSEQILHPKHWPQPSPQHPAHLGIAPMLHRGWRWVGGGTAGEQRVLGILVAGSIGTEASQAAAGWDGGRFAVWEPKQPGSVCEPGCSTGDVGVIAFRWRHHSDIAQFSLAVPAYMTLGLLAQGVNGTNVWKLPSGYVAVGNGGRSSSLAFAPSGRLALDLASKAARSASSG